MSPAAPPPSYDSEGNLALEWLVVVRYDAARKCYTLSWNKDGDLFRQHKQGAIAYPIDDRAGLVEGVTQTLYMLINPTLF